MDKLEKQLQALENSLKAISEEAERAATVRNEILHQTKETNGRVTALEKKHLVIEAIEKERLSNTNRLKNYVWSIVTAVSVSLILGIGGLLLLVYRVIG